MSVWITLNVDIDEMIHWNWWLLPLVITERRKKNCTIIWYIDWKTKKEKAMLGKIRHKWKEDEKNLYQLTFYIFGGGGGGYIIME